MADGQGTLLFPHDCATLYVTATERGLDRLLRQVLSREARVVAEPYPRVLTMACDQGQLRRMCRALSSSEREQILFHLAPNGEIPSTAQLMQSRTLQQLNDCLDAEWIARVVRDRQLVTYFQPIVDNGRPTSIYAYECLLRGIDENGGLIPPLQMISAARDSGLLPDLDQAAQLLAIESARQMAVEVGVFINFSPRLLDVSTKWIECTIQATLDSGIEPGRFVFEVVESDEVLDLRKLLLTLDWFRDAGCRVALDDVGAGYNSLNLLTLVKPDFVKLDMELVRGVHQDPYKSCVASKLLELARELEVLTIAEGIETHEEWQWTREHGADMAQGYLFAKPAPLPPTLQDLSALQESCPLDDSSRETEAVPVGNVTGGRSVER